MKRQVIQPEYLRAGALLQARDLEKLRDNFYFRALPAEHGDLFVVAGDGHPTRFTTTTQTGIVWPIASASAVSKVLSLNGIRQFFQIPTTAPSGKYQVLRVEYHSPERHNTDLYLPAELTEACINTQVARLLGVSEEALVVVRRIVAGQP